MNQQVFFGHDLDVATAEEKTYETELFGDTDLIETAESEDGTVSEDGEVCEEKEEEVCEIDESLQSLVLSEAARVKPILKEKFLKDYILGIGDSDEAFRIYCDAFEVQPAIPVRMVVVSTVDTNSYDCLFFIKNAAEMIIDDEENLIFSDIINHTMVLVVAEAFGFEIEVFLDALVKTVRECYAFDIFAVYSRMEPLAEIPEIYDRIRCINEYFFYSDGNKIMYESETKIDSGNVNLHPRYTAVEEAVKFGDIDQTKALLQELFTDLEKYMPRAAVTKTYCLGVYASIIRCCNSEEIDRYMAGITTVQNGKSFSDIRDFITDTALEIAEVNKPDLYSAYSPLVKDAVKIIDENLGNEKLSLRWIAGSILYTNVDYLGKIFKKETGKNFSYYVMEKRMEIAKALISEGMNDRIYEVAEKVGYGSNSQYFSRVFKKYAGISPLEYKLATTVKESDVKVGLSGTFKLDAFDRIAAMSNTSVSNTNYAIIVSSFKNDTSDVVVRMYTQEGKMIDAVAKSVKFWGSDDDEARSGAVSGADLMTILNDEMSYLMISDGTNGANSQPLKLCKYKLNTAGELTQIYLATNRLKSDGSEKSSSGLLVHSSSLRNVAASSGKIANYTIPDGIIEFTVPENFAPVVDSGTVTGGSRRNDDHLSASGYSVGTVNSSSYLTYDDGVNIFFTIGDFVSSRTAQVLVKYAVHRL